MTADSFPPATLEFGDGDEELRGRLRAWLAENDPGQPPPEYAARIEALTAWQAALAKAGFVGLAWPREYGGGGLDVSAEAVLAQELAGTDMGELINRIAVYMVGPTLMELGSESQRQEFLPGMLDASELWCQGFSEPEAGSDLAAIRTSARREGDELVLNGHKIWTSRGGIADWCAALVRTDPDGERHRGLSMAIVDMSSTGVEVAPLPQLLGEPHFSEVFFDDVRVPVDRLIGGLGGGWKAAMSMLSFERGPLMFERSIRLRRRFDELVEQLREEGGDGDRPFATVGAVAADLAVLEAQAHRTLASQRLGTLRAGATSVDKLLLSKTYQHLFAAATDLLGQAVALTQNEWTHDLLESRGTSIYGGTSEIQLNIVAKQLLGERSGAAVGSGSDVARSADEVMTALLPIDRLLAAAAADQALDADLQKSLIDFGWNGVAVTEAAGGLGLDPRTRAALAALAGARLMPASMRGEAFLLAPLLAGLADAGDADAGAELEALIAGEQRGGGIATIAPGEPLILPLGPGASRLACLDGSLARLIDLEGAEVEPVLALHAGQGYARVGFDAEPATGRTLSGPPVDALRRDWLVATLAEAYGAGRRALDLAIAYAGERRQFGRPIGDFQAVEHLLARATVGLEGASATIGGLLDGDARDLPVTQSAAAHSVPAAARQACETAIQVHGGMGFTWELGLHLYYRRVLAIQSELGGDAFTARVAGERCFERGRDE
ncbi:MAG TPA: acyl-CoA dehydrogenase family protein [Solirubrobacterales bacterium]|nr:acyl-CoA dehydrogenase family protein [Solirubrobacterales bacterium]